MPARRTNITLPESLFVVAEENMSKPNTDEIRKTNKTDPSLVKKGDLMAITYYVKVEDVRRGGEQLSVRDVVGDTGGIEVFEAGEGEDG